MTVRYGQDLQPMPASSNKPITAFVLAGGGSFGAIQVGMLHSLVGRGEIGRAHV